MLNFIYQIILVMSLSLYMHVHDRDHAELYKQNIVSSHITLKLRGNCNITNIKVQFYYSLMPWIHHY